MEIAAEIEPEVIQTINARRVGPEPDSREADARPLAWLQALTSLFVFSGILFLPIAFGGVHPNVNLNMQCLGFVTLGLWLLISPSSVIESFPTGTLPRRLLNVIASVGVYAFVIGLILLTLKQPHPILGFAARLMSPKMFWAALGQYAFFVCSIVLLRTWVVSRRDGAHLLYRTILISGFVVSLIAISHWFYDRGKLFWIFEPNNVFQQERARWPFVNPNHLAHFLIPIFFLFLCQALYQCRTIAGQVQEKISHSLFDERKGIKNLVTSSRFQVEIVAVVASVIGILSSGVAISGTLSRGGWLGSCIALLLFIALERKFVGSRILPMPKPLDSDSKIQAPSYHANPQKRRRRRSKGLSKAIDLKSSLAVINYLARPLIVCFAVFILYAFLAGRGTDLIEQRINYGLMYSKDDLRWELYDATMPMIRDHLFFGVGLGNWLTNFPLYVKPEIAGLNPEYLHSDPLQFLAEVGLVGSLVLVIGLTFTALGVFKQLPQITSKDRSIAFALILGFTGLIIASFLDFPFHIPAISFIVAAEIVLLLSLANSTSQL